MARERRGHQVEGGCCALVVVYLLGKVYVANAGDSRYGVAAFKKALGGGGGEVYVSFSTTPVTPKRIIVAIIYQKQRSDNYKNGIFSYYLASQHRH